MRAPVQCAGVRALAGMQDGVAPGGPGAAEGHTLAQVACLPWMPALARRWLHACSARHPECDGWGWQRGRGIWQAAGVHWLAACIGAGTLASPLSFAYTTTDLSWMPYLRCVLQVPCTSSCSPF